MNNRIVGILVILLVFVAGVVFRDYICVEAVRRFQTQGCSCGERALVLAGDASGISVCAAVPVSGCAGAASACADFCHRRTAADLNGVVSWLGAAPGRCAVAVNNFAALPAPPRFQLSYRFFPPTASFGSQCLASIILLI